MNEQAQHLKLLQRIKFAKQELAQNPQYRQSQGRDLAPMDLRTDKAVHDILQQQYITLFNAVKTNPDIYYIILDLVTRGGMFSSLRTYHNIPVAESVLNDVIGLGVISRLIKKYPNITDIGYNGRFMTYETNNAKYIYGKQPGENAKILTKTYINHLISKFTYNDQNHQSINPTNPIFNGMYNNIRVSVTYQSLTPRDYGSTFALRVSTANLPLNTSNFDSFAPNFIYTKVMSPIVKSRASILISGETGSAKTSFQKLIIGLIQQRMKIVMIEDTPETHLDQIYPQKDIIDWITDPGRGITIAKHVETSLRNNPDWVMIAEVRDGKSAYQMFQSVKTGHAIMTTLHAKDNKTVPSRFAGMIRDAMPINEDALVDDFLDYFDIGVHCSAKEIGGHKFRYMDQLAEFVPKSKKHPDGINVLFEQHMYGITVNHQTGKVMPYRDWQTFPASQKLKDTVMRNYDHHFEMPFTKDGMHKQQPVPLNDN